MTSAAVGTETGAHNSGQRASHGESDDHVSGDRFSVCLMMRGERKTLSIWK